MVERLVVLFRVVGERREGIIIIAWKVEGVDEEMRASLRW